VKNVPPCSSNGWSPARRGRIEKGGDSRTPIRRGPAADWASCRGVRVARRLEPGERHLRGAQGINVFTQRARQADVVIADGWIAGVGPHDRRVQQTLAITYGAILPWFIDSLTHLESTLLTPSERARIIVPHPKSEASDGVRYS